MRRLIALAALLGMTAAAPAAEFTVDVGQALKPVDHAASGALYGIAGPGWPPQQAIDLIHPKNFTQMAPGGGQLPNGETKPVGDALIVAPIARTAGASVTIRMADIFPSFPYIWQGDDFWRAAVARIVKATVAANPPNIYAYEIWNEPDWAWQSQWGDFNAVWTETAKAIRAGDPARRLMGPSASKWDAAWMRGFLAAAKTSGTVPDVVSWHELDPAVENDIEAHVTAYRALEKELGLAPHPISINEYGSQRAMGTPAALLHYIAQLERAGVDTADLAFWHRPGRLGDLLVPRTMGTGPATDPLPNGAAWLYNWYGGMSGNMVAATAAPGGGLDGIASYDDSTHRAMIIVGGMSGDITVKLQGLGSGTKSANVAGYLTRATGTDGFLASPDALFNGTLPVAADGTAQVIVNLARDTDAAAIALSFSTAAAANPDLTPVSQPERLRLEAESGTFTSGRKFAIRPANFGANRASGDAYAGLFNKQGAAMRLPVTVSAAGRYDLAIGYSNGQAKADAIALTVNGTPAGTLDLLPTQGRELFGLAHATVELPSGSSTLTLMRSGPPVSLPAGPSVLEFDYVDVAKE